MYAEAALQLPFMQGAPQEVWGFQHDLPLPVVEDLVCGNLPSVEDALNLGNLVQMSTISEYDLGGEGDLFKAPEAILGEPVLTVDPITAAMSMMSGGGSVISAETIKDMSSIQNEDLLNEDISECKKDLIAKSAITELSQEESDVKVAPVQSELDLDLFKNILVTEGPLSKSVSAGCLKSVVLPNSCSARPNFLDFQEVNLESALGMRRAYSDGDIQTLGNNSSLFGNPNIVPSSFKLLPALEDIKIEDMIEERRQKIFRYKKKRTKRNFGRKIKYACRKALADSQPRIRGRFARTEDRPGKLEECQVVKLQK